MPNKIDRHGVLVDEQPISWVRAFLVGIFATNLMLAFIDTFNMLGLTPFSLERYVGSLLMGTPHGTHVWTIGLLANWVFGGIAGILYGYYFEYFACKANTRFGVKAGFGHAFLAAIAIFPFFNIIHEEMNLKLFPHFGILGSGIDTGTTFMVLLIGHLLFGATMGVLYGPVREERVLAADFEPGEIIRDANDPWRIDEEHDPIDRVAV